MKKLFISLFVCFSFAANAQDKLDLKSELPKDPKTRTGTLSNGLKYYIRKNAKPENRVEMKLVVKAGSSYENEDQQGLAHFCEHMAFNGTKTYPGNQMVKKLESVGIKFGQNLNAYTSFDQTVYMLQAQSTDSVLNLGFQVLEDWSCNLALDSAEIEKERGVIIEEWRLGQGADERMQKVYWPILFKDSKYAERLPIGKKEVIESFKHNTLRQFYKDWYRPDLMAVVIVGDFDIDKVEKTIKERFSKLQNPKTERPALNFPVPDHKDILITKATDKEAPYTSIQVMRFLPIEDYKTVGEYRRNIVYSLYTGLFNERLNELSKQANPPFVYGYNFLGEIVRTKRAYGLGSMVKEDGILKGLETLVVENEKIKKFGFTETELERKKKEILRHFESSYNEREKAESDGYANEYIRNFLNGEPFPGIEFEYDMYKKFLPTITISELNTLSKTFASIKENSVVIITGPEKENLKMPNDKEILNIINNSDTKNLTAYKDNVINKPLLDKKPDAGKIVSEKKIKELNITEWQLSNGVKVYYKPTDFKNDEILFTCTSYGGYYLYPEKENLSASNASTVVSLSGVSDFDQIQLQKLLSDKKVSVNPYVRGLTEGFNGNCSPKDMETMMQLIYAYTTKPRKDSIAFQSYIQREKASIENRSANPESAFNDTISCTMNNYSFRARPSTVALLNEIDMNRAFQIYKDRFADASDFKFYFVGNIDTTKFKGLVETYIASLPSTNRKETFKDPMMDFPKGKITKVVTRGKEEKATIFIEFKGPFEWNRKNRVYSYAFNKIVNIKLREAVREDKGGTYGIGAGVYQSRYPKSEFTSYIQFGCNPTRVEELKKTALDVIEGIKKTGVTTEDIAKLKEIILKERETSLQENRYWLSTISNNYDNDESMLEFTQINSWIDKITSDDIKNAANKYFSYDNCAEFIHMPETN